MISYYTFNFLEGRWNQILILVASRLEVAGKHVNFVHNDYRCLYITASFEYIRCETEVTRSSTFFFTVHSFILSLHFLSTFHCFKYQYVYIVCRHYGSCLLEITERERERRFYSKKITRSVFESIDTKSIVIKTNVHHWWKDHILF